MSEPNNQLGILTDLQQKEGKTGSSYVAAWIKRLASDDVHLHQSNLADKRDAAQLANGKLVFFDTAERQLPKGNRLYATNCRLSQPPQLLEYLLSLDPATCSQFGKRSAAALREALLAELEKFVGDTKDQEIVARLAVVKSELLPPIPALPVKQAEPLLPILPAEPLPSAPSANNPDETTFLRHVFTANSPEYARRLFPLLVEGVRAIADEDSFRQALFLLEFNAQLTEGKITDLPNSFYLLATPAYRFQFWLRGLVPYCDTDILLNELSNGDEARRQRILERCNVESGALLAAPALPAAVPVLHAYFQSIKAALLEQLVAAQTSIRVAVAWFTQDELFAVLCEKLQQNVIVELIINNDYINNWEFGLPFAEFIALGGKLYLSEHPAMMHHKFCVIDEAVLFTGSYNWTYYADLHNEENALRVQNSPEVVASFLDEFERLKQQIGNPATTITPFPAEALGRFERIGFRGYLSKDLHSRVSYTRKTRPTADPQRLAALLNQAIEIDENNEDARRLLIDVAPAAVIDDYAVRAQEAVRQQVAATVTPPVSQPSPESASASPTLPTPTPVPDKSLPVPLAVAPATTSAQLPVSEPTIQRTLPAIQVSAPTNHPRPAATPHPVVPARPAVPTSTPSVSRPVVPAVTPSQPPINTSISIPDTRLTSALYENLHLVFALDYSNSMEGQGQGHSGYKLYSTGKIQKVVDMIFGVAKGLTSKKKVDMFLFEQKAVQLPEVTEKNYASYVQDVVMKHRMNGTNIYAPIQAIHEKYADGSTKTGVFVILITDGENNEEADNAKIKAHFTTNPDAPIFWQFVGLGADFKFLEDVAATASNAAFFSLNDVQSVSNGMLLEMLLQKFPKWYKQAVSVT